jgi:hypothetical protein
MEDTMGTINKMLGMVLLTVGLILLPANVVVSQVPCEGNFDCDLDVDGTDASVFKSDFGRSKFSNPCPNCDEPPVPIPKTGQTTSYHDADDGWMEKGVPSPNPRFTDNGDGTVTDNMTWLIWLKDAYCPDVQAPDWNQAVDAAFNLHGQCTGQYPGMCGLTDGSCIGDWRMPNIREMLSIIDYGNRDPALPDGHPFTDVMYSQPYWTSTSDPTEANLRAFEVVIANGHVYDTLKNWPGRLVWPVRGGQ